MTSSQGSVAGVRLIRFRLASQCIWVFEFSEAELIETSNPNKNNLQLELIRVGTRVSELIMRQVDFKVSGDFST